MGGDIQQQSISITTVKISDMLILVNNAFKLFSSMIALVLLSLCLTNPAMAETPIIEASTIETPVAETAQELANTTEANTTSPMLNTESNPTLNSSPSAALLPMLSGLLVIVAFILVIAYVAKKFNLAPGHNKAFKLVTSLSLGGRERIVVIEVQGQQHTLGVTPQSINYLFKLDKSLDTPLQNLTDQSLVSRINKVFGYTAPVNEPLQSESTPMPSSKVDKTTDTQGNP